VDKSGIVEAENVAKGLTLMASLAGMKGVPKDERGERSVSKEEGRIWLTSMRRHRVTVAEWESAVIALYEGEGSGFWPLPGEILRLIQKSRAKAIDKSSWQITARSLDEKGNEVLSLKLTPEEPEGQEKALPEPEGDMIPMTEVYRMINQKLGRHKGQSQG